MTNLASEFVTDAIEVDMRQAFADAAGVDISYVSIDFIDLEEVSATTRRRMVAHSGTAIRVTINVPPL